MYVYVVSDLVTSFNDCHVEILENVSFQLRMMDKLVLSFKRFRTFLVVFCITFPILVTFSLIHHNFMFDPLEQFSNFKVLAQNATSTTVVLEQGAQNFTVQAGGGEDQNTTVSALDKVLGDEDQNGVPGILEEQTQTETVSDIGPKNHSLEALKNDASLSTTTTANDKLLDGLLVSTFDEASCLSRYQSYLYRKASPHKPSAYLISKLRNYERLHRSCGPQTKSYNKVMRKGAKFSKNDAGLKCKYLVWTASNGLGNRMLTLAAAFLYAILTDRVLLVKFGADMLGLFCEPCPDSSWLLPSGFPYRKDQKHIETYESMLIKDKTNSPPQLSSQFLTLNIKHTHDGHNNYFHCDRSQNLLQKVPVLILRSDQYFVPSLFMIPSFRQELSKMFPETGTVFHHLGRYLFHPSNEAWELIKKFYEAHLAKANERIGLQIRVFNTHRAPHQTIVNEIIACTLQHNLLPELHVQNSATSLLKKPTSKAVLVASLYSVYGEKLRTMYQANTTVTGEVIKVYQPSHEGRQKLNNDMHNMKAWTEIYLLSLCDALITSYKSTFGYVAQSLGGLKPWILKKAYGETIPNPPCQRAMSMDPCFQYPPKYDCKANRTVDYASRFHFMEHCEDVTSGLKLVNANH